MRQLRFSSTALGSCIPNLGQFLACHNLAKIENLERPFYGMIDHPLGNLPSKYYYYKPIQRGDSNS